MIPGQHELVSQSNNLCQKFQTSGFLGNQKTQILVIKKHITASGVYDYKPHAVQGLQGKFTPACSNTGLNQSIEHLILNRSITADSFYGCNF